MRLIIATLATCFLFTNAYCQFLVQPGNPLCTGNCNGTLAVTPTGAYTYGWSNGATTASVANLCAGAYSVTVFSGGNAVDTLYATLTDPAFFNVQSTLPVPPLCYGYQTGSTTVLVTGGTQPYSYAWNTGATTATIDNLFAGNYAVTATDANGCSLTTVSIVGSLRR